MKVFILLVAILVLWSFSAAALEYTDAELASVLEETHADESLLAQVEAETDSKLAPPVELDDLSPASLSLLESDAADSSSVHAHAETESESESEVESHESLAAQLLQESKDMLKDYSVKKQKLKLRLQQKQQAPTVTPPAPTTPPTTTPTTPPPAPTTPPTPPAPAPKKHKTLDILQLNGPPKDGGVDEWTLKRGRSVFNTPFGQAIGNVFDDSKLAIQAYQYNKNKDDEVLWGYGYVYDSEGGYGGWLGVNACGWFPLQRKTDYRLGDEVILFGDKGDNLPTHPQKCPDPKSKDYAGAASKLFKQGSYLVSGGIVKAGTTKDCPVYSNYDPLQGKPSTVGPFIPKGTVSGKGAQGEVPSKIKKVDKTVNDFGVQFVTKDGKFASIAYPRLDPKNEAYRYFFLSCDCIQFDTGAINALNALGAPKSLLEVDESRDELEQEEFSAVETSSAARFTHTNNHRHGTRGNYPGWRPDMDVSMLEIGEQELGALAPAPAAAAPAPAAVPAPVAKAGNVERVFLKDGQTSAKLPVTRGIEKLHVHVYGKEDVNIDVAARMKNMVTRLASNQKKSYSKIQQLLTQLQKCSDLSDSSVCVKRITKQLQDARDQFTPQ